MRHENVCTLNMNVSVCEGGGVSFLQDVRKAVNLLKHMKIQNEVNYFPSSLSLHFSFPLYPFLSLSPFISLCLSLPLSPYLFYTLSIPLFTTLSISLYLSPFISLYLSLHHSLHFSLSPFFFHLSLHFSQTDLSTLLFIKSKWKDV